MDDLKSNPGIPTFNIHLKKCLLICFVAFYVSSVQGQGRFFLRAGGGLIYYNGDLNDRILTHPKLVKPVFTAAAGVYVLNRASIGIHYFKGRLIGNDVYAKGRGYQLRNLSFQTKINEVALVAEISLFPLKTKYIINPFIGGGIGLFTFNPEAEHEGKLLKLQPLGTEGQFVAGGGYPKPYKLTQAVAPAFIGFYAKILPSLRVRLEISNHFTFTDYLDDVSKSYPDSAELASTPNGALAVLFSNRKKDKKFPGKGSDRGNNLANDSYTTVTLTLVYNPRIGFLDGKRKRKGEMDKCFGW